jgi:hypothetical protein
MSDKEDNYYDENLNYYQRNKEKLRKYNREYYKRRQESDNPLYIYSDKPKSNYKPGYKIRYEKQKSNYKTGEKIMCEKCGRIVRARWIKYHQETLSCKNPKLLPLRKRNLLNLRNKIDSDDEDYFKL